jgi:hypothetical protein
VLGSVASGAGEGVDQSALALMPLPKSSLGPAASSLPLHEKSGVQTNADAARSATGNVTAAKFAKLGRISGYELDYDDAAGHALAAGHGLLEVDTGVELYRSPAAARDGLAFWRKDDANIAKLRAVGISASMKMFRAAGVAGPSYGATAVVHVGGKTAIHLAEVVVVTGSLLAKVEVSAADAVDRRTYAVSLAKQLAARIRGVLAGRITGPAAPLPPKAKPGPPKNGPELSLLALSPSDLGGGTTKQQGYKLDKDTWPVSEYSRTMSPAGPFPFVVEEVALYHSPTEASFNFAIAATSFESANVFKTLGSGSDVTSYRPTRVTVHAGDEARAVRAAIGLTGGRSMNVAFIVIRTGAVIEIVTVASSSTVSIPGGQIQGLAAAAGARAAAGLEK